MKSDLRYYYVCDFTPEVKVTANIEGIELEHKETNESAFQKLILSTNDAKELIEMLEKAIAHILNIKKGE